MVIRARTCHRIISTWLSTESVSLHGMAMLLSFPRFRLSCVMGASQVAFVVFGLYVLYVNISMFELVLQLERCCWSVSYSVNSCAADESRSNFTFEIQQT